MTSRWSRSANLWASYNRADAQFLALMTTSPICLWPIPDWLATDLGLKQWQLLEGDAVAAINCLYDLVQQHQRMQEGREQVQEQLHKVKVGRSAVWHSAAPICVRGCCHISIGSVLTACKLRVVALLKLRRAHMVAARRQQNAALHTVRCLPLPCCTWSG